MPFLSHAPAIYFERDDISLFAEVLSERLRADQRLRPSLDRIIGNQWYEFEVETKRFIGNTLFQDGNPIIDLQVLHHLLSCLRPEDIEIIAEIFLRECLLLFPLLSASALNEVVERLVELVLPSVSEKDLRQRQRQRSLARLHQKLINGALFHDL